MKNSKFSPIAGILLVALFMLGMAACSTLPATELVTEPTSVAPPTETGPAETNPTETAPLSEPISPIAQLAIEDLANQTGISEDSITVQTFEGMDWPNGCLGIEIPNTACTEAIVPGYRIILQANGQSYEYRSNMDGSMLLLAKPILTAPNNAVEGLARAALAQLLGISESAISTVSVEQVDWPDSCMGVTLLERMCLMVITTGYRIVLQAEGKTYEYHTNKDGSQMLLATSVPTTGEIPTLQVDIQGGIAGFCDHVIVYASGLAAYQSCTFAQETRYQLTPAQLQTLQTLVSEYDSFEYTQADPAVADQMTVQFIFNGQGKSQPTQETYQQMQALALEIINYARGISPATDSAQYLPLAGLTYTSETGLWQIGSDGTLQQLFPIQEARLIPDGQTLLTWDGNDLFLTNVASGETANLTNTPNRIEILPQSSGIFADKIFFTSFPNTAEGALGFTGYVTVMNLDGTGYQTLDEENNAGIFSVSPDEKTVAYGGGQTVWLYHLDTESREAFTATDYGVSEATFLSSPSWSPDGDMLAWIASGSFGGQDQFALAVFELNTKTGAIFHPYQLTGIGGFPSPGVWSPDGSFVALNTFDANSEEPGVWVVPVFPLNNRRPEVYVQGTSPIWSLDSKYLVTIHAQDQNLLLIDTGSWETMYLPFPDTPYNLINWQ